MRIYLTKYALSYGILEAEAAEHKYIPAAMTVSHIYHPKWGEVHNVTALKNEWTKTREEARTQAGQKKLIKIVSLTKQIKKLERMVF